MNRTRVQSPNLQRPMPPGQVYVDTFPIYDITPHRPVFDPATWRFRVWGAVECPVEWTWDDLLRLPTVEVVADFHCVTRWSKRALVWEGIPVRALWERVRPRSDAVQVIAHSMEGYTTNVPLTYFGQEDSLLAFRLNGEPLTPEHGAPSGWSSPSCMPGRAPNTCGASNFRRTGHRAFGNSGATTRSATPGRNSGTGSPSSGSGSGGAGSGSPGSNADGKQDAR